jgi:hypothetical protein
MPTNSEPVQFDQLPKEYDQRVAQRVLEASVRRVAERRAESAQPAPTSVVKDEMELLQWLL